MTNPIKGNETPTIEQVIRAAIEARVVDMHTMLPGEFVSYDPTLQKADVKLCIKRKYVSGKVVELPVIVGVPVLHPRTEKSYIHLPIKVGDKCMVVFSERSIDSWKKSGGCVDPRDSRKFHLSDAVAIPGLYSFAEPIEVENPDDLTLVNDQAVVELLSGGKFRLRKKGGDEVIDLLVQITDLLEQTNNQLKVATTNTIFGALQLNNFAQFAIMELQIQALKNKLDALRGV